MNSSIGSILYYSVKSSRDLRIFVRIIIGKMNKKEIQSFSLATLLDICGRILPKAKAVVAYGTCAAFGGVQAAKPNPTGAMGVNECFGAKGIKAINIGGCPPNPLNLVGTLVAFLRGDNIELDANNRPMMFYGSSVHDQCERREHFDNGEFAPSFDSEEARNGWCLYELGCKGPDTMNNCPKVKFNGPGFWDKLSPFYEN